MIRRTAALLFLSAAPLAANVIFADNFNGSGSLNSVAPDTRPATQTWVASPQFSASGSVSGDTRGSATLAFTPLYGRLCTLDARFTATRMGRMGSEDGVGSHGFTSDLTRPSKWDGPLALRELRGSYPRPLA